MSDLDDEELEATRIVNGAAKESDIEEDIKRCEELIKPGHANWIGMSNQLAIAHVLERIKELEAKLEFKSWGDLDNTQFEEYMNGFIPKRKVKDFIKELKLSGGSDGKDNVENLARELAIEILEELLEENNK